MRYIVADILAKELGAELRRSTQEYRGVTSEDIKKFQKRVSDRAKTTIRDIMVYLSITISL